MMWKWLSRLSVCVSVALAACSDTRDGAGGVGGSGMAGNAGASAGVGGLGGLGGTGGVGGIGMVDAGGSGGGLVDAGGGVGGSVIDGGTDAGSDEPRVLCEITLQCDMDIADEPKTDCALRIATGDGVVEFEDRAGVERRGRTSQAYAKPNYAFELRDASGIEKPTNLLGMGRESDWILDGLWVDRAMFRNELVYALYRSLAPDRWAPRGRFCNVMLNGAAQGIYRLGERIKRDDDRIDIPADDGSGQSFVIKQDADGTLSWMVIGDQRQWKLIHPNPDQATSAQSQAVQAFLSALDVALQTPDLRDAAHDPFTLLDLDAAVDFVVMEELSKNVDAYYLSLHLWKAPGQGAQFVPWDFDLSMGNPVSLLGSNTNQPSGWVMNRTPLIQGMTSVPAFRTRLAERWRQHRMGPLSNAAITAIIDRTQQTLTPEAVAANFAIWPLPDVNFNFFPLYQLYPVSSYADEVMKVRAWLEARLDWIDTHVDGYPN